MTTAVLLNLSESGKGALSPGSLTGWLDLAQAKSGNVAPEESSSWSKWIFSFALRGAALLAGEECSSYLKSKIERKCSSLIPAAAVGAATLIAKIAFDFFSTRPSFNIVSYVPTADLIGLMHWGAICSLTLRKDPPKSPGMHIKITLEEAVELIEKPSDLKEIVQRIKGEPVPVKSPFDPVELFTSDKIERLNEKSR